MKIERGPKGGRPISILYIHLQNAQPLKYLIILTVLISFIIMQYFDYLTPRTVLYRILNFLYIFELLIGISEGDDDCRSGYLKLKPRLQVLSKNHQPRVPHFGLTMYQRWFSYLDKV